MTSTRISHPKNTKLRRVRIGRNWTQVRLSAESGVALATLTLAEVHGLMSPRTAIRLATALGCKPEDIGA